MAWTDLISEFTSESCCCLQIGIFKSCTRHGRSKTPPCSWRLRQDGGHLSSTESERVSPGRGGAGNGETLMLQIGMLKIWLLRGQKVLEIVAKRE